MCCGKCCGPINYQETFTFFFAVAVLCTCRTQIFGQEMKREDLLMFFKTFRSSGVEVEECLRLGTFMYHYFDKHAYSQLKEQIYSTSRM